MKNHFFAVYFSFLLIFAILLGSTSAGFAENSPEMLAGDAGVELFNNNSILQDIVEVTGKKMLEEANAGSVDAMLNVAYYCACGKASLFLEDYEEGMDPVYALEWFKKAAAAGNKEAVAATIREIGFAYLFGISEDIPEDITAAVMFFETAEGLGDYAANNYLGIFYTYGSVVDKNPDRALDLFLEGAKAGYTDCEYSIEEYAYAYYAGTDEAIDINFGMSFKYYKALALLSNPRAMYNLGLLYIYGLGVSADRDEGVKWLTRSSDAGFERAAEKLLEVQAQASSDN